MEEVVMNLAIQYAKNRGLNKVTKEAMDYAYDLMGIEQEEEEYTSEGIYGMGKNMFAPKNLMKNLGRNVLSNVAKKAMSGGSLSGVVGPGLLLGGLYAVARATDPLRPGSRNYNPYLQDQLDYVGGLDGYLGRNPTSGGLQYGPNSVLHGKNAISMFGTNDYIGMLEKKQKYFEDRLPKTGAYSTGYAQKGLDKTNIELQAARDAALQKELAEETKTRNRKNYSAPYQGQVHGNGGGNPTGSPGSKGAGGSDAMGSFRRGGIANINMNKGQLGETLHG